jgi:signal transduction histidine kinase
MGAVLIRFGRSLWWALFSGRDDDVEPPAMWWRWPPWLKTLTACTAVVLLAAISFSAWGQYLGDDDLWLVILLLVLQVTPIVLLRRHPLSAGRVAALGMLVSSVAIYLPMLAGPIGPMLADWPLQTQVPPYLVVLGALLARTSAMRGVAISVYAVLLAIGAGLSQFPRVGTKTLGASLVVVSMTIAIGYILQQHRRRADAAEQAAVEERAKRATLEERALIARELHDIVGHHLSLIALRTDSAKHRVPGVTPAVEEEFHALGIAAREALNEARRLVGVLRETDAAPEREPQPGLADVPVLIESCRRSGIEVRSTVSADCDVPEAVGLAAYRIVQEALSNAARHSPGSTVDVQLRRDDGVIDILVENGPAVRTPAPSRGDGTGLAGIAERVTLIGGSCDTGPRADGGFRVAVTLNLARG